MAALLYRNDGALTLSEILENLEDDTFHEYSEADIFLCPPNIDDPRAQTDEDSGDDECGDPDRLARRLLMTEAEVHFAGKVNDDDNSESDQGMEETSHLPQFRK
ncbi:hypothetical protein J6590_052575 [Homalodisca vitripennis]|nr:hypothetical protein J6590_096850 [Homalodisca vitripennis]KAG8316364.1 hypothetical protein J6590_052575 [Homalodisca vitripennis]